MHSLPTEPGFSEFSHRLLGILVMPKLDIDIAHRLVPQVVAPIHLFTLPVLLLQFCEHLFKEVTVFLHLHVAHVTVRSVCGLGGILWIPAQAEQHNTMVWLKVDLWCSQEHRFVWGQALILKVKRAVNIQPYPSQS